MIKNCFSAASAAVFLCLFPFVTLLAQPTISCPDVTASPDTTLSCSGCVNLSANPVSGFQPTTYNAQAIPYNPYPFNAGTPIIVNVDDVWSAALPIPFNFCFYGNTFNSCVIGSNGILSFDLTQANGFCPWQIPTGIPNPARPVNCIMGPYHDIDPMVGGTIRWALYGNAPCRVFVVSFESVPMYNNPCNSLLATHQIVIYETTNIIETYIQNKPLCTSWNSGAAIHGVHNANGTAATVVPGRNFPSQWTASNDAWRFVPAGPQNFTVNWFQVGNPTPIASTLNTQVCPQMSTDFYAEVVYTNCDNTTVTVRDTASVTVNAPVILLNPTLTPPSCPGASDGTITVAPTGGAIPYTYAWSPSGGNGPTASNLSAGTYTLTLTDNNGCIVVDSFVLADPPGLVIATNATAITCFGLTDGSASASASGGTPGYSYLWQPGNIAGPTASNLAAGSYTVIVTDSNGCIDSASVTISQPSALTLVTDSTAVSCFGGTDGTASVVASGGTQGYTYAWNSSPVQTTATATGLPTGTYTVTVTDQNQCTATATVNVLAPPPLLAQVLRAQAVSCNGAADGWAVVSVTGANGPVTYNWNTIPAQTQDSAFGLSPGTWTVTVTDSLGCQATANVTINEPAPLNITFDRVQNASCFGANDGCAGISVTGGNGNYGFLWSNNSTADSICNLSPGTYAVTVTDTFFPPSNQIIYFEDFDGLTNWTLNVPTGANGADNNFWVINDNEGGVIPGGCGTASNGDSTLHITSVFNPNGGAAYDAGGACGTLFCPETNMRAESPQLSTVGFSNLNLSFDFIGNGNALLDNASLEMNDGSGWQTIVASLKSNICTNLQGEWQNFNIALPASANNKPNLQIGLHWTNNDDGIGSDPSVAINNLQISSTTPAAPIICTSIDSVTIVEPDSLQNTFTVIDVACNGDSSGCLALNLTGGNGNFSYLWSTGDTLDSICGLPAGTYSVTITDTSNVMSGGGSSSSTIYTEDFDGPLTWTLNVPTGLLGADPNFWVVNDNEGGVTPPGCGVGSNGDSTLHITSVFNSNGGAAYDAGGLCGILFCPLSNYRAESPLISTIGQSNLTLEFDYISVGDALLDNASVVYNDGTGWQVLAPSIKSSVCTNSQGQWTAATFALPASCNNIPNLQIGFNWTNNDDGLGSDPSVAINDVRLTAASVSMGGPVFCTLIDSVTINEPPVLNLAIAGYDVSCFGFGDGAAAVTISGGTPSYSVVWSNQMMGDSISGLSAGTYTAFVQDSLGCQDSISIQINEPPQIILTMSKVDINCNGAATGCAQVMATGGSGGFTYTWSNVATTDSICGLTAGTYTVTVTDTSFATCMLIDSITITEPPLLVLSGSTTGAACSTATGTATVTPSGGTPGYTYAWNTIPVQTTATAVNLLPGPYSVQIIDSLGCVDTLTVSVPNIPGPNISLGTITDVSCFGGSDGSATALTNGGTTPITITWNVAPPQSGPTATGLSAGTYTVVATDANGCQDSTSFTIAEPTQLTLALSANGAICNQPNGSATATASGGTFPYQYNWSNNQTTPSVQGLAGGTYVVTVTDANNCQVIDSVNISQAGAPTVAITNTVPVSCFAGNDGAATATANGGTPPYTLSWNTSPQQVGNTATGLTAGVYTVVVTDNNGCQSNALVTITEPTALVGTVVTTDVGCVATSPNGTAGIAPSGGTPPYSYTWNTVPVQTTAFVSGLSPGTYTVTVVDANGCELIEDGTVDQQPSPTVVAGPDASFCEGDGGALIFASASGGVPGYYYQWWCDSTNTFCGLDSMFDNDPIANPTVSTWYYVQAFDTNGCPSNVDSLFVEVLEKPVVDAGPDIYLCGDSAPCVVLQPTILGNAPGPYTYTWMPGAGLNDSTLLNPCARPDTTTIYALVVTSANGCSSDLTTTDTLATVTVHVNPIPIAEAGPDIDMCLGDSVVLQGFATGAGPDYTYQWTPGYVVSDSTIANPVAFPSFTTTLSLVVFSNGCPSYADSVTVNVHTNPTVEAGWDREICLGGSTLLDAQAGGDSTASYSYLWWPTDGFLSDSTAEDPVVSPDTTTTYYVVSLTNWGCQSAPDSATVYVKPTPIAEAGENLFICFGACDSLSGSFGYTTTLPANPSEVYYSWSPNQFISDTTVSNPEICPPASMWYYLEVRHRDCVTRDSVFITVGPEIGATAGADTSVICQYNSVQLNSLGSLGEDYTWIPSASLDDPNSPNPIASPDSTTTYLLVVEEGGCFDSTTISIEVIPGPRAGYQSSLRTGCVPHSVDFTNLSDGGIAYIWDMGDGSTVSNSTHVQHTYTRPGTYTVSLTALSSGACSHSVDSIEIVVVDTARADFITEPGFPVPLHLPAADVNFFDRSQNAQQWYWDFGDGLTSTEVSPRHTYTEPGEYFVTLIVNNALGCVSTAVRGPFLVASPELFIPNVFSPNDDNVNDVFRVDYSGDQPFTLQIFDRWGVLVYESRNKTTGWTGKDQENADVPEGVYYYHVKVGGKAYSGHLTLVR